MKLICLFVCMTHMYVCECVCVYVWLWHVNVVCGDYEHCKYANNANIHHRPAMLHSCAHFVWHATSALIHTLNCENFLNSFSCLSLLVRVHACVCVCVGILLLPFCTICAREKCEGGRILFIQFFRKLKERNKKKHALLCMSWVVCMNVCVYI